MSDTQADPEKEKLRAFEKKMHDEGAAGFADGPSPWETWDDDSEPQANKRVWEGTSKRIYPNKSPRQSLGDRVLSALAMLSLATMVVGIAGVYFSDKQPRQDLAKGIQPLPIKRTPQATDPLVARLEGLPAPAAGTATATGTESVQRGDNRPAHPTPVAGPGPETTAAAAMATARPVQETVVAATDTDIDTEAAMSTPEALPVAAADTPAVPDIQAAPGAEAESLGRAMDATPAADEKPATGTTAAGEAEMPASASATDVVPDLITSITAWPEMDTEAETAGETVATAPVAVPAAVAAAKAADTISDVEPAAIIADLEALPAPAAAPATTAGADTGPESVATASVDTPTAATDMAGDPTESDAVPEATTAPAAATGRSSPDTPEIQPDEKPAAAERSEAADHVVAVTDRQDSQPAAATPAGALQASAPVAGSGEWVVNLASYTRESIARRMLAEFRDKGVDAELVTVAINDRPMHRLRVTGFANSREAKARIDLFEDRLGLEGVWISRR